MDLARAVTYRSLQLNTAIASRSNNWDGDSLAGGFGGCIINSADMSDVDIVQFMEKRSLQDGMDAGDVYLGARRLRLAGTLYGATRGELFDRYMELRAVLSPTLAQRFSPADKGFLPLDYYQPTNRLSEFDGTWYEGEQEGVIHLRVLAIPHAFQCVFQDSAQGAGPAPAFHDDTLVDDSEPLAVPWQATFILKDPTIQGAAPVDIDFFDTVIVTGGTASAATNLVSKATHGLSVGQRIYFTSLTGGTGLASPSTLYYVIASGFTANAFKVSTTSGGSEVNITGDYSSVAFTRDVSPNSSSYLIPNRGNYHGPFNMLFGVGPQAGTILVTLAGSSFTITVPASTGNRIIRYKGADKILTVEENDVEEVRMKLLSFLNSTTHPLVPGGNSTLSVQTENLVIDSSHGWFWETYA